MTARRRIVDRMTRTHAHASTKTGTVLRVAVAKAGDIVAEDIRLAVIGAGLIGRRHVDAIRVTPGAILACIVDPSPEGHSFADSCGVDWFASIEAMFATSRVDGTILATPNQLHADGAMVCIENHCPVLVER